MKDKTIKLQRVKNTVELCKNMAKHEEEEVKTWNERGSRENAFTSHMLAQAYSFIASMLERDLKDDEEDENDRTEN